MELKLDRALHEHALPVALLILALTILSAASFNYYRNAQVYTETQLGKALFSPLVHAKPTANGLADFSVGTADPSNPLAAAASAGQATDYSFSFGN
ncbi:MAG TPA: hypothetical protein VG604_01340 [Candidatus Saccharimonadales bacterium]|nr:hypothetical protein [Candidatus Saccharimonadales bacterium]